MPITTPDGVVGKISTSAGVVAKVTDSSGIIFTNAPAGNDGTAAWGSWVNNGSATGGGTIYLYGSFSAYSPTTATCAVDSVTCLIQQTRTRTVQQATASSSQPQRRTCVQTSAPTGSGSAGTCSNPSSAIGGFDYRNVVTPGSSYVSVTPTVANGGIGTRFENVPNTAYLPAWSGSDATVTAGTLNISAPGDLGGTPSISNGRYVGILNDKYQGYSINTSANTRNLSVTVVVQAPDNGTYRNPTTTANVSVLVPQAGATMFDFGRAILNNNVAVATSNGNVSFDTSWTSAYFDREGFALTYTASLAAGQTTSYGALPEGAANELRDISMLVSGEIPPGYADEGTNFTNLAGIKTVSQTAPVPVPVATTASFPESSYDIAEGSSLDITITTNGKWQGVVDGDTGGARVIFAGESTENGTVIITAVNLYNNLAIFDLDIFPSDRTTGTPLASTTIRLEP